ncbi:vitamin-B12 independent methionine synthase [Gordonia sp. TBRC 11910]|uniref:Vitamin-B12 independent methionine synthase n=2 Tax=Gordonia asplenii TaxID=2725283 RepID=A0A848KRS2_9ACTN|nr:vitamin-B12 independent methionine synthase [Gordonia asplenii]
MPGTDPRSTAKLVAAELDWPFLAELPARGLGADMIGRTASVLVEIALDTARVSPGEHPTYRIAGRPGHLVSRARGYLDADLDAAEEVFERTGLRGDGRPFTITLCGPYTFAATVELASGHKVLHDRGAVRDVAASMAEGLAELAADVERRLGCAVIVQLDEPLIGAVLDGRVRPLTRLDVMPEVSAEGAAALLGSIAARVNRPVVVHSCATPRWDVLSQLSNIAVSLDVSTLDAAQYDSFGSFVDRGGRVVAGVIPTTRPSRPISVDRTSSRLADLIDRIGLPRKVLAEQVAVSPTCGLAGADQAWAGKALGIAAQIGQLCAEDPMAL